MKLRSAVISCLFFTAMLYGQTDALSVTGIKSVDLTPDEVTFNVVVLSDQDATLDQVLEAIKDSGVTARDLGGVGSSQFGPSPTQSRLVYQFTLVRPLAQFKDTLDKFTAARRSLLANNSTMELQTNVVSIQASDAAREQGRQQATADLIADARKRADALAKAAGVTLGSIVGINEPVLAGAGPNNPPIFGPFGPVGQSGVKTTFSMPVRFAIK